MSVDADPQDETAPKKKGMMLPLILGVICALLGGGGGFWAVTSGPLAAVFAGEDEMAMSEDDGNDTSSASGDSYADGAETGLTDVAFVALERVTISIGDNSGARHLIFAAQLEVAQEYAEEVTALRPRILDVLNSYLRVVGVEELSTPTSLARLRAQMLHRIQIVAGDGRVRDLLITEFVVN